MQIKNHGLGPLLDLQVLRSLWSFDAEYGRLGFGMPAACNVFFQRSGYEIQIHRDWESDCGGILFFAQHTSVLDGNALSLACPLQFDLRRVIFWPTGKLLGRRFARRNILIWPKLVWRTMVDEIPGVFGKFKYFISHRCGPFAYFGPWARPGRNVERIGRFLSDGSCVAMLPSGMIGESVWRTGIGAIVCNYARQPENYRYPLKLAPVYIDWSRGEKRVTVEAPVLLDVDAILSELRDTNQKIDRQSVTQLLEKSYCERNWQFSENVALRRSEPSLHQENGQGARQSLHALG